MRLPQYPSSPRHWGGNRGRTCHLARHLGAHGGGANGKRNEGGTRHLRLGWVTVTAAGRDEKAPHTQEASLDPDSRSPRLWGGVEDHNLTLRCLRMQHITLFSVAAVVAVAQGPPSPQPSQSPGGIPKWVAARSCGGHAWGANLSTVCSHLQPFLVAIHTPCCPWPTFPAAAFGIASMVPPMIWAPCTTPMVTSSSTQSPWRGAQPWAVRSPHPSWGLQRLPLCRAPIHATQPRAPPPLPLCSHKGLDTDPVYAIRFALCGNLDLSVSNLFQMCNTTTGSDGNVRGPAPCMPPHASQLARPSSPLPPVPTSPCARATQASPTPLTLSTILQPNSSPTSAVRYCYKNCNNVNMMCERLGGDASLQTLRVERWNPARGVTSNIPGGDVCGDPNGYLGGMKGLQLSMRCADMAGLISQNVDIIPSADGCSQTAIFYADAACPAECPVVTTAGPPAIYRKLCGGHGVCDYDQSNLVARCFCNQGWSGRDCMSLGDKGLPPAKSYSGSIAGAFFAGIFGGAIVLVAGLYARGKVSSEQGGRGPGGDARAACCPPASYKEAVSLVRLCSTSLSLPSPLSNAPLPPPDDQHRVAGRPAHRRRRRRWRQRRRAKLLCGICHKTPLPGHCGPVCLWL